MLFIIRYLSGFLRVVFCGDFTEKILNLCAKNRIALWDSQLTKEGIETSVTVDGFRKLRTVIRGSGVRVHILKKTGLPFNIKKHKSRLGLLVGAALFLIFLELMGAFVWIIDVTGNKKVDKSEIIAACNKIGIYEGIRKSKINPKIQREKLLLESESLAWASLNVEGCRLTVNVSETKNEREEKSPSNLRAKSDGIIKKIDITSGNCLVKKGDTVKKGDVLVSGIIEGESGTQFVRSTGKVEAEIKLYKSFTESFEKEIRIKTGEGKRKSVLEVFTLKLPLFLGAEVKEYDFTRNDSQLSLFGQSLPIRLYSNEIEFVETKKVTLSEEKVTKELEKKLENFIKQQKLSDYVLESREIVGGEEGMTLSTVIVTQENIAENDVILISNENQSAE